MKIDIAEEVKGAAETNLDVKKCKKRTHDEAITQLHEHLRCMVNNPAFSDVVFICNDGVRVHAIRNLLAGRSEMLKGMLVNGMAESSLSEIKLTEFDSPVMLSVLEFVYSGNLVDHRPLNWTRAFKTLKASQFFLLPLLADIVRSSLYSGTGSLAQDLTKAAVLLTEALGYTGLWDEKDIILMKMVSVLRSNWLDSDFVGNLSEDALHYLLSNTKCESKNVDELSFYEYCRFRQLIRWWIHHSDSQPRATEELVNLVVPDEERALAMCMYPEGSKTVTCPEDGTLLSNERFSFRADEAKKNAVIRLMPTIDCRKIHPALLENVVDPLEIVSSAEMMPVYRFHALRRPMVFKKSSLRWEHGKSYRALEQGYVIEKTAAFREPAILLAAMSRSVGTYHWCFVVEIVPATYYELGFLHDTSALEVNKPTSTREWLCKQRCARVLSTWRVGASEVDMCRVNRAENGECESWEDLSQAISKRGRADFFYNAHDRTCSVALNGQDCGIIWKDLPRAIYYPAVSLGPSPEGRVRVELVSGFDIL